MLAELVRVFGAWAYDIYAIVLGSLCLAASMAYARTMGARGGRVAAISVPVDQTEKLVTIIELKKRGDSDEEALHKLSVVKNDVTAAISQSHGLNVADLVLVPPGSIPTTTSGKIQRHACVEQYRQRQFTRLDA